jgi:hypothetical protein
LPLSRQLVDLRLQLRAPPSPPRDPASPAKLPSQLAERDRQLGGVRVNWPLAGGNVVRRHRDPRHGLRGHLIKASFTRGSLAPPSAELPVASGLCHGFASDRTPEHALRLRGTFSDVTLHEAIVEVLRAHGGGWMDRDEIAAEIAGRDLYRRADGAPPPSDQIRLRARKPEYQHLFECSDTACNRVRLRPGATPRRSPARRQSSRRKAGDASPTRPRSRPVPSRQAGPNAAQAARLARARRDRAARRFRPETVKLLLVAEAPPASLDRYFYFPDVRAHDSLFRHVASELLKREPSRENKAELLGLLRDAGVFLIDLKLDPADGSALAGHVPSLLRRVRRLQPEKIILIKATVHDAAFGPLRDAGFPVVDVRVPFPGSGQQARFREAFRAARRKRPRGT